MPTSVYSKDEIDSKFTAVQTQIDELKGATTQPPTPEPIPEPPQTEPQPNLYDDFNYTENFVVGKQSQNGKWLLQYTSQGYAKTDGQSCVMQPGGTELTIFSGSVLVRSTKKFKNGRVTFYITNEEQIYTKDKNGNTVKPPGWHSPWPFGRHVDKYRHWYVIVGRDKVEMGRKEAPTNITDQATIERYQYTIWTGPPATPIGVKRKVTMEFIGNKFSVYIDDKLVKTLVDDGTLIGTNAASGSKKLAPATWDTGEFCMYNEGCRGRYDDVYIEVLP